MDAIVEFCRSKALGPIHRGLSANEVQRLLGPPNSTKSTFEDSNREKYRYGSVFLTLTAPSSQEPNGETLKVTAIDLSVHPRPLRLPDPIAAMTTYPWDSTRADDILAVLRESGLDVQLEEESTIDGMLYQVYRADGGHGSRIVSIDGNVSAIHG
jgi:hypothetical protein